MRTKAAVLKGKKSIEIRDFELPQIGPNELLVKNISNSICLSTFKAAKLGEDHFRVPPNIAEKPIITGHEFAGIIVEVGTNLVNQFKPNQRFVLQPAMGLDTGYSAGYSYEYFGGNATYCIIPIEAIERDCVLSLEDDYFANGSLAEPMSCIIGAYNASYHTKPYIYKHDMGIKDGGKLALLGSAGPMGLGAISYALCSKNKPELVVVTDIDQGRLDRAKRLITPESAMALGITLVYLNASQEDAFDQMIKLSNNQGFDDVFVFSAISKLIEQADDLLGQDGCLNFFAGPTDKKFKVPFNFYDVHYTSTHIVGTSGGSKDDMKESLTLSASNKINPSYMLTHIGGINAVPKTIINLDTFISGKIMIYPHIEMELTSIEDIVNGHVEGEVFKGLKTILKNNNEIWSKEAEKYLLDFYKISVSIG